MARPAKDDVLTLGAIAVLAMCFATAVHFVLGHGGACLGVGGRLELLTSVHFECSVDSAWVALGGPAASFLAGLAALVMLSSMKGADAVLQQVLLLTFAFNSFWLAGGLFYSALFNGYDWYWVFYPIAPAHGFALRLGEAISGAVIYLFATREVQIHAARAAGVALHARQRLAIYWLAASAAACAVALLYPGQRLANAWAAGWEVGAWSAPLIAPMIVASAPASASAPIARHQTIVAVSLGALLIVAITLGKGLP